MPHERCCIHGSSNDASQISTFKQVFYSPPAFAAATNATYRPLYVAEGAIGFAWDEGRDYLVSAKYVGVTVRSLLGKFAAGYAPSFVAGLIASAGGTTALVSAIATTRPNLLTAVSLAAPSVLCEVPLPARASVHAARLPVTALPLAASVTRFFPSHLRIHAALACMQPIGFTEENLFPFDVPVALQGEIIGVSGGRVPPRGGNMRTFTDLGLSVHWQGHTTTTM